MKRDENRDRLVDIFAQVYGWKLPLRTFQRMAVEQIDRERIDAILAAGWEPTGLAMQYEASQGALSDLMTEHRELRERLDALAKEWDDHGFAEHPGRWYADQLRTTNEEG